MSVPRITVGKPTATPIGEIAGLPDGRVWINAHQDASLSAKEARSLSDAIGRAAYHAENYHDRVTGKHRPRLSFDGTGVLVTVDGVTRRMRVSDLRKDRKCDACEKPARLMYVEDRTMARERALGVEVCSSCVIAAQTIADLAENAR